MQNYNDAIRKAMEFAQTREGQQLIAMLRQAGGNDLENAIQSAASGNMTQARQTISQLMNNPEAKKILEKMEL